MRVRVDTIGHEGFDFDEPVDEVWIRAALGDDAPYAPAGPGHLEVHLERGKSDVVQARGSFRVALTTECARCLYPVEIALNQDVDVVLFPLGSEPPPGPDGEVMPEDMGVATYQDGEVDLSALLRDEIFLEMPMTPTCGLEDPRQCEHFMANLGDRKGDLQVDDRPVERPSDPRWAALSKVKLS